MRHGAHAKSQRYERKRTPRRTHSGGGCGNSYNGRCSTWVHAPSRKAAHMQLSGRVRAPKHACRSSNVRRIAQRGPTFTKSSANEYSRALPSAKPRKRRRLPEWASSGHVRVEMAVMGIGGTPYGKTDTTPSRLISLLACGEWRETRREDCEESGELGARGEERGVGSEG